jgi:hypothetical protein
MEDNTTPAPTMLSNAFRWAMICAAISIIISMAMYAINYEWMVQLKMLFISLAVYLGVTIYGGIDYRNSIGGYLGYGKAWQHGFLILAISGLVATLWSLILYTVIDPELPEKLADASIENTRAMMDSFGMSGDALDDAMDQARDKVADQFTIVGIFKSYLTIVFFSAIMALISALIVRKNEPEMI